MRTMLKQASVLITAAAVLAGCGADDGGSRDATAEAAKLATAFTQATGVRLTASDSGSYTVLRPQRVGEGDGGRFGSFSIYVAEDDDRLTNLVTSGGFKRYPGGIAVSSPTSDRDPDVARRLDQALRAAIAGDPSLVPVRDRPCAAVGIDPARGKEGTCRLPDKQLTVVNAASELQTEPLAARLEGATTVTVLPRQTPFGEPRRARGRYVVVRTTITNRGNVPLNGLRTSLIIGPNTYSESSDGYQLQPRDRQPFPLQPGASTELTTAYDIPIDAAEVAIAQGAIELPAQAATSSGYVTDRGSVGRIRLADARRLKLRTVRAADGTT